MVFRERVGLMKGKNRYREWLSIMIAKNPSRVILMVIMLFNILFMLISALIISRLAPISVSDKGFAASVFYTISMILDAGCISYVVEDVGEAGVVLIVICLVIIMLGMIGFTGGIIGYITNVISGFIENANAGDTALKISGHTVILNWNNRASEIINELIFREQREKVVVLVPSGRQDVEKEIENRLADTIKREETLILSHCNRKTRLGRWLYLRENRNFTRPVVIVREGNTFAEKELMDISLEKARSVIILNRDYSSELCRLENEMRPKNRARGNSNTIKTLVLVAQITASEESSDNQKIIVDVEDSWTEQLVEKIIDHKENLGKCNIVPMKVNRVLGQLLAQFSIMPELNLVYSELFSNRGAEFYAMPADGKVDYGVYGYMETHSKAIPLTSMKTKAGKHFFFMADVESEVEDMHEKINDNYGHDTGDAVLRGFAMVVRQLLDRDTYCIRWGGEEFMVLTSIQTLPELKEFAEKIRLQVEKTPMAGHKITCSLGITLWQTETDTTVKLFKRVDDALYQAKKNGRNCVMVQLQ